MVATVLGTVLVTGCGAAPWGPQPVTGMSTPPTTSQSGSITEAGRQLMRHDDLD